MRTRQHSVLFATVAAVVVVLGGACSGGSDDRGAEVVLEDVRDSDAAGSDPSENADDDEGRGDDRSDAGQPDGDASIAEIALAAEGVLSPEQAECVVDDLEEELDVENLDEAEADDIRTMMRIMLECAGVVGVTDCFVDSLLDISGIDADELDADAFVEAVGGQSPEARVELAQAGLICQGATPEIAECVTDSMIAEFGGEIFERDALVLTDEQRSQLVQIQTECVTDG